MLLKLSFGCQAISASNRNVCACGTKLCLSKESTVGKWALKFHYFVTSGIWCLPPHEIYATLLTPDQKFEIIYMACLWLKTLDILGGWRVLYAFLSHYGTKLIWVGEGKRKKKLWKVTPIFFNLNCTALQSNLIQSFLPMAFFLLYFIVARIIFQVLSFMAQHFLQH